MEEVNINQSRIRNNAPFRKSMSMTELDVKRALELERVYNTRYPSEAPFNFSKTISKALEIACMNVLVYPSTYQDSTNKEPLKTSQSLTSSSKNPIQKGKPKKFQKTKRGFN